jgi:hypothetical protein
VAAQQLHSDTQAVAAHRAGHKILLFELRVPYLEEREGASGLLPGQSVQQPLSQLLHCGDALLLQQRLIFLSQAVHM